MLQNSVNLSIIIAIFLAVGCGQIKKGSVGDIEELVGRAKKNIFTAESIENLDRKNRLLEGALSSIRKAESFHRTDTRAPSMPRDEGWCLETASASWF